MFDNSPPHCQLPHWAQQTAKTLSQLLAVLAVTDLIQVVRGSWTKGLKCREERGMEAVRREKKWRRETKPNGCTHQQEEKKKQEAGSRTTNWLTADWPTNRKWNNGADHSPYRWRQRSAPQPWVQKSCASPAGRMGPGPKREEQKQKREEETDSAAPHVIMQWIGSANGGGAGCFVLYFSAGEVTRRRASLVPNSGAGPQYRATSERHTHTGVDKAGVC